MLPLLLLVRSSLFPRGEAFCTLPAPLPTPGAGTRLLHSSAPVSGAGIWAQNDLAVGAAGADLPVIATPGLARGWASRPEPGPGRGHVPGSHYQHPVLTKVRGSWRPHFRRRPIRRGPGEPQAARPGFRPRCCRPTWLPAGTRARKPAQPEALPRRRHGGAFQSDLPASEWAATGIPLLRMKKLSFREGKTSSAGIRTPPFLLHVHTPTPHLQSEPHLPYMKPSAATDQKIALERAAAGMDLDWSFCPADPPAAPSYKGGN